MAAEKKEKLLTALRQFALDDKSLEDFLLANSNLPGPRGNLELAFAFADFIGEIYAADKKAAVSYCHTLIENNPPEKQARGNEEFLPFCGIVALGRIGKIDASTVDEVLILIKKKAQDSRWRIREAVAMTIQELMDEHREKVLAELERWLDDKNWLVWRAVVAGLAEPRLVKNEDTARRALDFHKRIIILTAAETESKGADWQALVKGLCYTLSVIITGVPAEGFAYLDALARDDNPVVQKIVRENLQKNRLVRLDQPRAAALLKQEQKR